MLKKDFHSKNHRTKTTSTMMTRNQRRGAFAKDVLEQPLIAHTVMSMLSAKDRISFASMSNDARFKETTKDLAAEARFIVNMRMFISSWNGYIDTCQQEFLETINDPWLSDNVVADHNAYLANRLKELCVYLRANWHIVLHSGVLEYAIRLKVNEMRDFLPAHEHLTIDAFVDDMNEGRLE